MFRVLDVGQSGDESAFLFTGDITALMSMLMTCLPHLTHLDISGTNLAGWVKEPPVSHRLTASSSDWSVFLSLSVPLLKKHTMGQGHYKITLLSVTSLISRACLDHLTK